MSKKEKKNSKEFVLSPVKKEKVEVLDYEKETVYDKKPFIKAKPMFLVACLTLVVLFLIIWSNGNIITEAKKVLEGLGIYTRVIPSVEIESNDYSTSTPGAWHIDKSAEWTGSNTAKVTFDVDTIRATSERYKDIVLVIDISGSMRGNKLTRAVNDAKEVVSYVLSDSRNRVALIVFDDTSNILFPFTNDKATLLGELDNLSAKGCTNYYVALKNVDSVMTNYQKQTNRELITLFLTDGYPNRDTPNEKGMYALLKDKYPYMTIDGIQYEMGSHIIKEIIDISDNQFIADQVTLNNILFEAAVSSKNYEDFIITDYVDNDYFTISSVNDIKVDKGKVTLTQENGVPKITWDLSGNATGFNAKMEIKLTLKNQYVGVGGYYPTNKRESITSKLPGETPKTVNSDETPVLENAYTVHYDVNTPVGCSLPSINSEEHAVSSTVTINQNALSCSGWIFKGWEIQDSDDDVLHINSDMFVMPEHDVTIRGTWARQSITKTMDGTVRVAPCTDFGRDDWATIVSCVQAGNTDDYHVGDTKEVDMGTLGKHTLRVVNNSNYSCSLSSKTACGFVLEFADIITTHVMNSTETNLGGFPASEMYSYLNGTSGTTIYNSLPSELKNAIINTTVVSGHGSGDANNFTTNNVKIYPLSFVEVYGSNNTYDTVTTSETRQLDYYSNAGVTSSNYSGANKQLNGGTYSISDYTWGLRSALSTRTDSFSNVYSFVHGVGVSYLGANYTIGVSPAFRLAGSSSIVVPLTTVTLDRQGGSGGSAIVNATYGEAMPSATAPSRSGFTVNYNYNGGSGSTSSNSSSYTFGGYYDATSGGTQYYTSSMGSARTWDKTGSTATLYARWSGGTVTLPTPNTRSGYTFNGWYTASSGGTKIGNAGASYTPTATTTLYAQWTAVCPTVATSNFSTDSWTTIISNVQSGNTSRYSVGQEKTVDMGSLGCHKVRVANNSNYSCSYSSKTACGFVLEFADIITTHVMNSTDTNSGGFPASEMYSYLNGTSGTTIYNSLPTELKNAIINTTVVSGYESGKSSNYTTNNVKIYPLSFVEVYGSNSIYDTVTTSHTRQLDYYSNAGVTNSNYSGAIKQRKGTNSVWWLRSATSNSTSCFWGVRSDGVWGNSYDYANPAYGVSPAFRLAETSETSWHFSLDFAIYYGEPSLCGNNGCARYCQENYSGSVWSCSTSNSTAPSVPSFTSGSYCWCKY